MASKDYEVVPLSELQYDADGNLNYQPTEEGAGLYVLYGNETFGNVFKSDNITLNEILSIIDSNKNIEKEYKPFIKEYFTDLVAMYPDLELRTFAYNLYSVKVITLSADKVADSAGKESIAAYWLHDENKIIINEDTDLENNAKDRLILRHEIGHLGNYFRIKEDDILYKFDFNLAYFDYVNECLTVIFTSSPYMDEYAEAEITNMGYPRGTNQMRVLLDCIDYTPDKIISNNYVLLQRKLDDVMGDYFDAATILTIIND